MIKVFQQRNRLLLSMMRPNHGVLGLLDKILDYMTIEELENIAMVSKLFCFVATLDRLYVKYQTDVDKDDINSLKFINNNEGCFDSFTISKTNNKQRHNVNKQISNLSSTSPTKRPDSNMTNYIGFDSTKTACFLEASNKLINRMTSNSIENQIRQNYLMNNPELIIEESPSVSKCDINSPKPQLTPSERSALNLNIDSSK